MVIQFYQFYSTRGAQLEESNPNYAMCNMLDKFKKWLD